MHWLKQNLVHSIRNMFQKADLLNQYGFSYCSYAYFYFGLSAFCFILHGKFPRYWLLLLWCRNRLYSCGKSNKFWLLCVLLIKRFQCYRRVLQNVISFFWFNHFLYKFQYIFLLLTAYFIAIFFTFSESSLFLPEKTIIKQPMAKWLFSTTAAFFIRIKNTLKLI